MILKLLKNDLKNKIWYMDHIVIIVVKYSSPLFGSG